MCGHVTLTLNNIDSITRQWIQVVSHIQGKPTCFAYIKGQQYQNKETSKQTQCLKTGKLNRNHT